MKFFVNALSIFRIFVALSIIPFFNFNMPITTFVLFITASISDFLDGFLARKYNVCTKIGGVIDHIADKILIINSFILIIVIFSQFNMFVDNYSIMIVIVPIILMIARELYISGLREFLGSYKLEMPVPKEKFALGKIKTTMQMFSVSIFLFTSIVPMTTKYSFLLIIFIIAIYLSLVLSIWSGIKYTITFYKKISSITN